MTAEPRHPLCAMTTYELRDYRRELERSIKGIAPDPRWKLTSAAGLTRWWPNKQTARG